MAAELKQGIVVKTLGGYFFVADKNRDILQLDIRGRIQDDVYPGDYVRFCCEQEIIEELLPRKNLLPRPRVANIEQILIVHSFYKPRFDSRLLDRFILMVEAAGLKPVLVLNKCDLLSSETNQKEIVLRYKEIGYPVFIISVKKEINIDKLHSFIKDNVNVLTGPSGTGKSSLINQLVPDAGLKIKPVSQSLNRGVHTTRHVELLPLEEKGWLADTPGFSSLEFSNISVRELPFLFPEFQQYLNDCRFNMCSHTHEPGCAIKEAVNDNRIYDMRYQSYQKFFEELKLKEEKKYD